MRLLHFLRVIHGEPTGRKATQRCPCGYFTDPRREYRCTPSQIQRYTSRISGPLLDRDDIHIEVPALSYKKLATDYAGETSSQVRGWVNEARRIQRQRFKGRRIFSNGAIDDVRVYDRALSAGDVEELFKSGSSFRMSLVVVETTGGFQLTWTSTPSVEYVVWSRTDPASGDWVQEQTVPSAGDITSWTDRSPGGSRKFYRIEQY